jgi:hypothetical protein
MNGVPNSTSITEARLMMYGHDSLSGHVSATLSVYLVSDDSWTEGTLTYDPIYGIPALATEGPYVSPTFWKIKSA